MKRNTILLAVALCAIFIALACWVASSFGQGPACITLKPNTTYQTMTGWEAGAWVGQDGCSSFPYYKDELFDQAANDLGINRLRIGIQSGMENDRDYWSEYQAGLMDRAAWRSVRYATVNDNDDPFDIDWDGFHFSQLDHTIDNVVLPVKQRVESNGENLFISVRYTAYTAQMGPGLEYHHDDPEEYAEFVVAMYLHLRNKYGWVPDAWEVINEPDLVAEWNGTLIGQAIVAAANRLSVNGFTPAFIAPSTADMNSAISHFDALIRVPGARQHLKELSYHRYGGVSDANLRAIADRGVKYGINTAMLEHMGSGYQDLYKDLKIARNSAWEQFTLGGPPQKDDGGRYYLVDDSNPSNPIVIISDQAKFLRQYFKFIRSGAVRIEATSNNNTFDPLAFINMDGKYVVVIKANRGGSFTIIGLPTGTYGIIYTTFRQYNVDAPDVTVSSSQALNASIPLSGVITIYTKTLFSPAPAINRGHQLDANPSLKAERFK